MRSSTSTATSTGSSRSAPSWPRAGVQIAPSSYYARKSRPRAARAVRAAVIDERLVALHEENMGVYGTRKMWKANRAHPDDPLAGPHNLLQDGLARLVTESADLVSPRGVKSRVVV